MKPAGIHIVTFIEGGQVSARSEGAVVEAVADVFSYQGQWTFIEGGQR